MCECTVYYNQKQGEHGQPLLVSGTVSSWSAFCVSRPTGGFKGAGSPLRRFFFPFSFAVERKGAGSGPRRPSSRGLEISQYLQKKYGLGLGAESPNSRSLKAANASKKKNLTAVYRCKAWG